MAVFARDSIGLTASTLAAVMTTQQFLFIFTKPFIGYLADYFNKLKVAIAILTVVAMIFLFLLLPIPRINNIETQKSNSDGDLISALKIHKFVYKNSSFVFKLPRKTLTTRKFSLFNSIEYNNNNSVDEDFFEFSLIRLHRTILNVDRHYTTGHYNKNYSINCSLKFGKSKYNCFFWCNSTKDCYISYFREFSVYIPDNIKPILNVSETFSQFEMYQFWLFAGIHVIAIASTNALSTLFDTACCESVVQTGADFGRQRMYGAIGWGAIAPIGGLLHDLTNEYWPAWVIMGAMLALSLWNLWKLDLIQPQFSKNITKDVKEVMSSKEFLVFQFGVLLNGIGNGVIWFYQIWFLTSIGASRFLCGLVQTVQCFLGEVPLMFFSGWFIRKIGHHNVLTLSLIAYCVRFWWYSYLENPWLVLPMEVTHGFTYGIFYPAVASYAKLKSRHGTEATTQSILFSTHEGLGMDLFFIFNFLNILIVK